jgi:hypothetical protein
METIDTKRKTGYTWFLSVFKKLHLRHRLGTALTIQKLNSSQQASQLQGQQTSEPTCQAPPRWAQN